MPFTFSLGRDIRQFGVTAPWQWVELFQTTPALGNKLPLVVCLHGSGIVDEMSDGEAARNQMGFDTLVGNADTNIDDLFFVLYLEGLGLDAYERGGSWNSGHMDTWSLIRNQNDVAFIEEAVDEFTLWMQRIYRDKAGVIADVVDPDRRFLVGFGNGGCMAYRSARSSDYWRGFAVVNGAIGGTAQQNAPGSAVRWTPVSGTSRKRLLHIHNVENNEFRPQAMALPVPNALESAADQQRLLDQGTDAAIADDSRRLDLPAVAAMRDWTVHNQGGAFLLPAPTAAYGGNLFTWSTPSNRVQYLEYSDLAARHAWPTTLTQDTSDLIWSFFRDGQI